MGKMVIYAVVVVIVLLALEFFQIVDIPYLEIPNYLSTKKEMVNKTDDVVKQIK